MGELFEQIYLAVVSVISIAVFFGIAAVITYASYARWRDLEVHYAATYLPAPLGKQLTGMIRIGEPGHRWCHESPDIKSRRHPPVTVGVYPEGLSLSVMPLFRRGCRDLFLPFDRMSIHPASWNLLTDEYGVRMKGVDHLEILLFSNVLHWAAERVPQLQAMIEQADAMREMETA